MYTIVLANTRREAHAWAREEGISLRKIKFAQNSQSIAGRFYDRIVELPSYGKRRDKHAVNAAIKRLLRSVKTLKVEKIEGWVMPQIARPIPPEELRTAALLGDVGTPFSNSPLVQPGQDPVADRKEMDLDLSAPGGDFEWFDQAPEPVQPPTAEQAEAAQEIVLELADGLQKIEDKLAESSPSETTVAEASKVTAADTSEEPVTVKPKKRGRRTNEQRAYDEAKAIFDLEQTEQNARALSAAYDDLVKRHPDDERVVAAEKLATPAPKLAVPGVAQGAPDLDF